MSDRGLETQAYLREVFRSEGSSAAVMTPTSRVGIRFHSLRRNSNNDPILDSIIAPTTTAVVDFITHTAGWKYAARYNALSYEVNALWNDGDEKEKGEDGDGVLRGSVKELREAVAVDPKMNVLIVHGMERSVVSVHGLRADCRPNAIMGNQSRVRVREYAGATCSQP